jgi:3-hydroxyacyl-[acyl-carrier-protein] dehydratase
MSELTAMDIKAIIEHIPHRYPMLLVDRVLDLVPGESIRALKNVSINEPYFCGHFPHQPVMPGVLIIEALAQTAAVLSFKTNGKTPDENTLVYFVGIDGARFKKPVVPGDQLVLELKVLRHSRGIWKYEGKAYVDGQIVCEAELMSTVRTAETN